MYKFRFFLLSIFFVFLGCNSFAKENVPYVIEGKFTNESNISQYELGGVDIYFFNKTEKVIKSFTVVFLLFDGDGEPINTTNGTIAINVEQFVEQKESINFCLSIDDYINFIPDDSWFVDYLYVSQIIYEDESIWSDPFGLNVF